jgi:hypothetical protein
MSYLGLIIKYGSHEKQIPAVHEEPRIRMRVISRVAKSIAEITREEFVNAYSEIHDHSSVIGWLERKYPNHAFTTDSIITVHRIEYVYI